MATQESEFLTIGQASVLLDESRQSTARRVAAGELPSSKLGGKRGAHLLHRSDVLGLAQKLFAEKRERLANMESAIAGAEDAGDVDVAAAAVVS